MPFDNYEHMHLKKLKTQLQNAEKSVTFYTSSNQNSAQQSSNISMRSYSPRNSICNSVTISERIEPKQEEDLATAANSSFVLNVPQKNEAQAQIDTNPEEIKIPITQMGEKKPSQMYPQITSNVLTHENLQIIQNRDRNKFGKSAAERHQR